MVFKNDVTQRISEKRTDSEEYVRLVVDGGLRETIKMVAGSSLVPPDPNINVGENERLIFIAHTDARSIRGGI